MRDPRSLLRLVSIPFGLIPPLPPLSVEMRHVKDEVRATFPEMPVYETPRYTEIDAHPTEARARKSLVAGVR